MSKGRQNVVIVGGGGGGATAARALSKSLDASKFNLILVDPRPHLVLLPVTIRLAVVDQAGLADAVLIPLKDIFVDNKGTFHQGKVVGIVKSDASALSGDVVLEDGDRIHYDVLILSPGSTWYGAFALPSNTADLRKGWAASRSSIKGAQNIVLVGAGAVGLELAGEIRSEWPNKSITVVQGSSHVLNKAYPDKFRKALEAGLATRNIDLVSNDYVDDLGINKGIITTRKGRALNADLIITTHGSRPNTEFIAQSLGAQSLTTSGHVKVRPTLQLADHPSIFAIGDIIDHPEQKQFVKAKEHATIVASNVVAYLQGKTLKPYKGGPEVIFVSLGKDGGAAYVGLLWGIIIGDWLVRRLKGKDLFVGTVRKGFGFR